jgi:predicted glutamine amidotransferase
MNSDTPRTDAARERYYDGKTSDWVHYTICRMIEQELAASKAEVARLQEELDATCNAEELRQERETRKRAEAEVERLKSDKAHLIAYCANLLEAANLVESKGKARICKDWGTPSVEWQRSHKVLLK